EFKRAAVELRQAGKAQPSTSQTVTPRTNVADGGAKRKKNCYICDGEGHASVDCPLFDGLVKEGWPLEKDGNMVVVKDSNGQNVNVGHAFGRGGIAILLPEKFSHLRKVTSGSSRFVGAVSLGSKRMNGTVDTLAARRGKYEKVLDQLQHERIECTKRARCGVNEPFKTAGKWEEVRHKMMTIGEIREYLIVLGEGRSGTPRAQALASIAMGAPIRKGAEVGLRELGVGIKEAEMARAYLAAESGDEN
ncbi:hypothetical protein HDU67_000161, partial [Dinochytrium kinnereticum]